MQEQPLHTIANGAATAGDNILAVQHEVRYQSDELFTRGKQFAEDTGDYIAAIARSLVDPTLPSFPVLDAVPVPARAEYAIPPLPGITPFSIQAIDNYYSNLRPVDTHVDMPPEMAGEPTVNLPSPPVVVFGNPPVKPDIAITMSLPVAPSTGVASPPVLHDLNLPSLPSITMPVLDVSLPTWDEAPPDLPNLPVKVGATTVDQTLLDQFVAMTLSGVPQSLLQVTQEEVRRIADQHQGQAEKDVLAVWEEFSDSRGFSAPPGAMGKRTDGIRADAAQKIRLASREVALGRMQMEVDLYKANLATGAGLVEKKLDADNAAIRLSFEIWSAFGKQTQETYNALVEVFRARNQGFQAVVDVYKARIQGELAKLDRYKAEVEGAKATVEVDSLRMRGYEAQLQAVRTSVDIYRAVVDAASTEMSAKAKQMEMYRSEVEAYAAELSANKVRYDIYETQVKAAMVPLQLYDSRIKAHAGAVEVAKTKASVVKTQMDAAVAEEEVKLKAYSARIDAITKSNAHAVENARLEAQVIRNGLDLEVERVKAQNLGQALSFDAYKAEMSRAIAKFDAAGKEWDTVARVAMQKFALRVEAAKAAATVSGSLASAALAGFHVQQSINASTGMNLGVQSSGHWSYSKAESSTVNL